MRVSDSDAATIRSLATRLRRLNPRDHDQLALLGFMVGVLYCLDRVVAFGFSDARMQLNAEVEINEQGQILDALKNASTIGEPWLAGFYLDSAMMRLAALNERIDNYLGTRRDVAKNIKQVVNQIKHEIDAGIRSGWRIGYRDVFKATEDLCALLEHAID